MSSNVIELKCPEHECDKLFTKNDIEKLVDKSLFFKYIEFYRNKQVEQNNN